VTLAFTLSRGTEALKYLLVSDASKDVWRQFGRVLRLGGSFDGDGAFNAPYVSARWPARFDPYEHVAITGSAVQLRARSLTSAPIVGRLDFDIAEALTDDSVTSGWMRVGPRRRPHGCLALAWHLPGTCLALAWHLPGTRLAPA